MSERPTWFTSRYGGDQGGACAEVALDRREPTHSGDADAARVEAAARPRAVHVPGSRLGANGPCFSVTGPARALFLNGVTA